MYTCIGSGAARAGPDMDDFIIISTWDEEEEGEGREDIRTKRKYGDVAQAGGRQQ